MVASGKASAPEAPVSITDARKMASGISTQSWQGRWNEDNKGRYNYEFIPVVSTRIVWPNKRDTAIPYCRILLHDTMLNKDSYRTRTSDTSMCECGAEEEIHILLHCDKYNQAREHLSDTQDEKILRQDIKKCR